jgi:hypothetical protein
MDGGSINCVARALPIDAALAGDVLLRLRRDTPGASAKWTLGGRGSVEVDVDFFPVVAPVAADAALAGPAWTTTARLWDPAAIAVMRAVVQLSATSNDSCELSLRPEVPLIPWWSARRPALLHLADAALDELAEELLWHASRPGVASGSVS